MYLSRRYGEALRFGERALELHSDFTVALWALGMTYCQTGQFDKATAAFQRLMSLSNRAAFFVGWAALAHALAGRPGEARGLAEEIAVRSSQEYVHPIRRW